MAVDPVDARVRQVGRLITERLSAEHREFLEIKKASVWGRGFSFIIYL
jgi:hypothetical protein